ncbi:MAG: hypothetical protein WC307_06065 [Candidatus Nanoarchaeia archaeon]|jgi:hypothetical protein
MSNVIIRLYDEDNYSYPLIEVKGGYLNQFKIDLGDYKCEQAGIYNIDEFLELLSTKDYFVRVIHFDSEVYF